MLTLFKQFSDVGVLASDQSVKYEREQLYRMTASIVLMILHKNISIDDDARSLSHGKSTVIIIHPSSCVTFQMKADYYGFSSGSVFCCSFQSLKPVYVYLFFNNIYSGSSLSSSTSPAIYSALYQEMCSY